MLFFGKPRRKKLIVHIGDYKTGSTAIQMAFAQGQVTFPKHSLCYPAEINHNGMRPKAQKLQADPNDPEAIAYFTDLANRIQSADADFTLISGETLERTAPRTLQEIIARFFAPHVDEVHVVSYVRPHAERILSSYVERIKTGVAESLTLSLEEYAHRRMARGSFDYMRRFSALRDTFGPNFTLRPMTRKTLYKGSVVDDFIHHAFDQTPYQLVSQPVANESLSLEDLMRLKVLQRTLLETPNIPAANSLRLKLGWDYSQRQAACPPRADQIKLKLHRSLAAAIATHYADDAAAVDQEFFQGTPHLQQALTRAVDTAIDSPQSTLPQDHLSPAELQGLQIMSEMMAELYQNTKRNWPLFLHQKRLAALQNTSSR